MTRSGSPPPPRGAARGTVNEAHVILGAPGTGKSTLALTIAERLAVELGAYRIASDPARYLPLRYHDGQRTGVRWHETVAAARAAVARDPRGVHAVVGRDVTGVVAFAAELAAESMARWGERRAPPVVLLLDDAGVTKAARREFDDVLLGHLLARRHEHLALLWTVQDPYLVDRQIVSQCTDLWLGRMTDGIAMNRLRQAGVPEDELVAVPRLPNHRFLHWRPGDPQKGLTG